MLYKAVVIDNSTFFESGTIRVRISGLFFGKITWDLSEDVSQLEQGALPEESEFKVFNFNEDFNARVMSSMGGGRNYGIFMLPQINEKGIVAFTGRGLKNPIWLGSLFEVSRTEKGNDSLHVNIPSDKIEAEGEDTDGGLGGEHNLDADDVEEALKKNIIIRTKSTFGADQETIDWQQRPTTNIISISGDEVRVNHFDEEDGWNDTTPEKYQTFWIHKNDDGLEAIRMEVKNDADDKEASFELTEEGMKVFVRDGGDENVFDITVGDNGINFLDQHGNKIIGTADGITVETDGNPINVKGSDIILDGDEIQLNGTGDTAVRFSKLISIIEEFENHVHITQGPAGPTSPAMKGPAGAPPIGVIITADKNQLESSTIKVK